MGENSIISWLAVFFKASKSRLGKSIDINNDWHLFLPCAENSIAGFNKDIKDINSMVGGKKGLITILDKKIEVISILETKKGNIINRLDKSKKINIIYLISIKKQKYLD